MQVRRIKNMDVNVNRDSTVQKNIKVSRDSMLSSKTYQVDSPDKPQEAVKAEPIMSTISTNSCGADISDDIKKDIKINSDGTVKENMNVCNSILSSKTYQIDTPDEPIETAANEPIVPTSSKDSNGVGMSNDNNTEKDTTIDESKNQPIMPTPSTNSSEADISDDIEKDINIDVAINNNSACTISHNSTINITYYNFESESDVKKPRSDGMSLYGVWLPKPYIDALEKLRTVHGSDPSQLAEAAYTPLLKEFGISFGTKTLQTDQCSKSKNTILPSEQKSYDM